MTQRATYNITDDRLRFYPGAERLSPEVYAAAKAAGFAWWPGQKIFVKVWTVGAEDFLTVTLGLEIEEDDAGDDVAARVERFEKYAENAEASAASVEARAEAGRLNTERRERLALGVLERETARAMHWRDRIAGAIRNAARKDNPHVILGRIKKLEAQRRKCEKAQKEAEERRARWEACASAEDVRALVRDDLKNPWEEVRARFVEKHTATVTHYGRWIAHDSARLEYERAYLEAVGGGEVAAMVSGAVKIEKGGAIQGSRWPMKDGVWYYVTRCNPQTVEIFDPRADWGSFPKIPRQFITAHKSAAEARALDGFDRMTPPKGCETPKAMHAHRMAEREAARAARNTPEAVA